jgi:hypothetical protein
MDALAEGAEVGPELLAPGLDVAAEPGQLQGLGCLFGGIAELAAGAAALGEIPVVEIRQIGKIESGHFFSRNEKEPAVRRWTTGSVW